MANLHMVEPAQQLYRQALPFFIAHSQHSPFPIAETKPLLLNFLFILLLARSDDSIRCFSGLRRTDLQAHSFNLFSDSPPMAFTVKVYPKEN